MNGSRGDRGGGWRMEASAEGASRDNNQAQLGLLGAAPVEDDDWDEPAEAAGPSRGGRSGGLYGGGGGNNNFGDGGTYYYTRQSMGPPAAMMGAPAHLPPLMVVPVGYENQGGYGHAHVSGGRSWFPPGGSRRVPGAADSHQVERILRDPHAGMHIPRLQRSTTPISRPVTQKPRQEPNCGFCNRDTTVIMCQHCDFTQAGLRVKLVCPKHPNVIFLSDWSCCKNCRRNDGLVELDSTAIIGKIGVPTGPVEHLQEPAMEVPVHEISQSNDNGILIDKKQEMKSKPMKFDSGEQVVPEMKTCEKAVLAENNKANDLPIAKKEHSGIDSVDSSQMNGNIHLENEKVTGRNHRILLPEITVQLDEMKIKESKESYRGMKKAVSFIAACQGCGEFTEHEDMPQKPLACNNETCFSKSYLKLFDTQGFEIPVAF